MNIYKFDVEVAPHISRGKVEFFYGCYYNNGLTVKGGNAEAQYTPRLSTYRQIMLQKAVFKSLWFWVKRASFKDLQSTNQQDKSNRLDLINIKDCSTQDASNRFFDWEKIFLKSKTNNGLVFREKELLSLDQNHEETVMKLNRRVVQGYEIRKGSPNS